MISVKTTARISSGGMLTIAMPKPLHDRDVEVVVAIQPVPARGWPVGFLETRLTAPSQMTR